MEIGKVKGNPAKKDRKRELKRRVCQRYSDLSLDLFQRIKKFGKLEKAEKYHACGHNSTEYADKLFDNLTNTEIDVVLQTPVCLLIGEAKYKTPTFNANGTVLVHQLIRQYVMAKTLLKLTECDKKIVPFLVVEDDRSVLKTSQVRFMIKQGWLKEENVLTWKDIKELTEGS